jgi:hypothetical protein
MTFLLKLWKDPPFYSWENDDSAAPKDPVGEFQAQYPSDQAATTTKGLQNT